MRKRSRVLAVLCAATVFMGLAMGSGSSSDIDKEIVSAETKTEEKDPGMELASTGEKTTEEDANASEENQPENSITVDEIVLLDQNDIKITATGMEDGFMGTELKVLIENNGSKSVTVQTRNSCVNGYMVETMISSEVAAGKKVNDSIVFYTSELKDCGIDTFATMEFSFHIFDSETWDTVLDSENIVVNTSAAATYVQEYDDSGDVIFEQDGIKIVAKGVSSKDSIFGPGLILYIENNSDKNITVQARDTSVNGFMIDTVMSDDIIVGKKAITALTFFSSSLEENGIDKIEDMEFILHIFDMDTWNTIVDTDVISLTF